MATLEEKKEIVEIAMEIAVKLTDDARKQQSNTLAFILKGLDSHTEQLGELRNEIKNGFEKVTNRQDTANGRTKKNEEAIEKVNLDIIDIKLKEAKSEGSTEGKTNIFSMFWVLVVAVVAGIIPDIIKLIISAFTNK